MASLANLNGLLLSGICEGKLELSSSCIQRVIIDGVNLLYLLIFLLFILLSFLREQGQSSNRSNTIFRLTSICCLLLSLAYLVFGLLTLTSENRTDSSSHWLLYIVDSIIWLGLTVSLLVQRSIWVVILTSVWWAMFFLLVSALNITMIINKQQVQILDIIAWLVNGLLSLCAVKNLHNCITQKQVHTAESVPLLEEINPRKTKKPSFFSQIVFSWINPLLCAGYSKPLSAKDIPNLFPEDEACIAFQEFSQAWEELKVKPDLTNNGNLVMKALTKVYWKETVCVGVGALIRTMSVVVSPLLLYAFVNYSKLEDENLSEGLFLVGCTVFVKLVESISQRQWIFYSRRTGMRMRSALMVAIYQKQLKLSSLGRREHSTGEIVNYISVDAYRMGEFPWWFHTGWCSVIQVFLSIGVLLKVAGSGSLAGLVPLLICGILNVPFARLLQNCRSKITVAQDERLRATSEILTNMKLIKLQSWEGKFQEMVEQLRQKEYGWLKKLQYIRAGGTALYWMSPTIISSVIFLGCFVFDNAPLTADTIFTILATLRLMSEPVRMIPEVLSTTIQVLVSLKRINTFLLEDELINDQIQVSKRENSEAHVVIQAGCFSWEPESETLTLRNLYLDVRKGQKVAVCGPVGAGKSSLLHCILKEMPKISGQVAVVGSIAYVSQTAWIQSGTIRENILYGKQMDEDRYKKAIKVTALDKDISTFSHGDLTEIGQRGINMSGGQKQRIQLARAVYSDADIYLLDDPFSAVDAHTAAVLFHDCVMGALKHKTVILVTHQVEFLSEADTILVMRDGEVTQCGSYQELLTAGTAFEQLVTAHRNAVSTTFDSKSEAFSGGMPPKEEIEEALKVKTESSITGEKNKEFSTENLTAVQLTEDEEKEIGDVGWKPYLDYIFVSKGLSSLSLSILAQILFIGFQTGSTYWLAFGIRIPNITNLVLISIYAGISSLSIFFAFLRSFFSAQLGLKASKAFFNGLNNSIFKAPMHFFDSTPVGRIFTRVASDLSTLDIDIAFSLDFVMTGAIELIVIIVIMASVTWPVLIVGCLALAASRYVQGYYLASAREITRINGTTKAPLTNHAAETFLGVTTIRAFNMTDRFFRDFLELVDTDAKMFFYSKAASEWLVQRIEALQLVTLFTATLLLVMLPKGFIAPGLVGLSLSYALGLSMTHVFLTWWYCNLETYIISVERIKQFMHIEAEPPSIVLQNRPPSSWPYKGRIELQELQIRYRPNAPLVLKEVTCIFKEGSRVGIVGRTGSGKTTLISALFRLIEPQSGRILIDGLDISTIGLKDLRSKLSIIPQEPTLFKGSVRSNLDPLGLYSDQDIWKALEKCQLKETISNLPNQLDSSVSDEGQNWSAGQRQLFCLGRVLLKRNRILVLDEATASIDSKTDAILQRIIREEFAQCTVITVAHRVPTVIDSDMVMVLSFGRLVEYDEPSKLMETNSCFSKLVTEYWSSCKGISS
ncbi:ABC transporter C family member 8-like isoform X1 [Silene latifolia]|uniref:ABC transporter C family member 8-like isoform X1 n=1 Tax=Silene latifolia TaxID=37657 RepID=UPI003D76FDFB